MRSAAVDEVLRAALPLVDQQLPLGADRVEHLLALLGQLRRELVELAEAALELLELEQQPRRAARRRLSGVSHSASALVTLWPNSLNCAPNSARPSPAPSSFWRPSSTARARFCCANASSSCLEDRACARVGSSIWQAADRLAEQRRALRAPRRAPRAAARARSSWRPCRPASTTASSRSTQRLEGVLGAGRSRRTRWLTSLEARRRPRSRARRRARRRWSAAPSA